jgi:hypothetical protein
MFFCKSFVGLSPGYDFYLKQEQPSLAMLSTGTTVHSTRSITSCFRTNVRDSSTFVVAIVVVVVVDDDVGKLENQAITNSVVLPIHCLKLDAETDHSWERKRID